MKNDPLRSSRKFYSIRPSGNSTGSNCVQPTAFRCSNDPLKILSLDDGKDNNTVSEGVFKRAAEDCDGSRH
jgi:hypothetical protein